MMNATIPRWLNAIRWLGVGLVVIPVAVFLVTHDVTPPSSPGGFGGGYENLFDILFGYGPVVSVGLLAWATSSALIWLRRRRSRKQML